jgi:hypothetical protein
MYYTNLQPIYSSSHCFYLLSEKTSWEAQQNSPSLEHTVGIVLARTWFVLLPATVANGSMPLYETDAWREIDERWGRRYTEQRPSFLPGTGTDCPAQQLRPSNRLTRNLRLIALLFPSRARAIVVGVELFSEFIHASFSRGSIIFIVAARKFASECLLTFFFSHWTEREWFYKSAIPCKR